MATGVQFSMFGEYRDPSMFMLSPSNNECTVQITAKNPEYIHIDNLQAVDSLFGNITWQIISTGACKVQLFYSLIGNHTNPKFFGFNPDPADIEAHEASLWVLDQEYTLVANTPMLEVINIPISRYVKIVVTNTEGKDIWVAGVGAYS